MPLFAALSSSMHMFMQMCACSKDRVMHASIEKQRRQFQSVWRIQLERAQAAQMRAHLWRTCAAT
eukprot:1553342-Pleurochrysis_carterae.AAC.1